MRRGVAVLTLYVFLFAGLRAAAWPEQPKQKSIVSHLFGPRGFLMAGVSTSIQHVRDAPKEWGPGVDGLGKRFASAFGHHLVKSSVSLGLAKVLHEDLKYYPSEKKGFTPRLEHALLSTVYARRTNGKGERISGAKISGEVAGGFVSRLWQPVRLRTFASGLSSTGISLGADAGMNVVREFWPEIRHPRQHRQAVAGLIETDGL